jgi:glyoxylate/succinic semialdehyde reductase
MTVTDLPNVGFLGLGIMGVAMARNLLKSGNYTVLVWNRTASKVRAAHRAPLGQTQ